MNFSKSPSATSSEFSVKYKERILQVLAAAPGLSPYLPGQAIAGDQLRTYSQAPILSGPLVCQLREADFVGEATFSRRNSAHHAGENEHRERVLYLMREAGC